MKIDAEVEVDEQKILDQMDMGDIFEKSNLDESDCKNFFGDPLLDEFTAAEIVAYLGADKLLSEIDQKTAEEYYGIEVAEE